MRKNYKKFITYKEQVHKLKNEYGLEIKDEKKAEELISTISYYGLINGYKSKFMVENKFISSCSLDLLFYLSMYDRSIQSVFIKYIIIIENLYKTRLAYSISNCIGDHESKYLDKNNYLDDKFSKDGNLIDNLNYLLENTKDNPTYFYKLKSSEDGRNIPPWILFKNIYFSDAINLSRLLKKDAKTDFYEHIIKDMEYKEKTNFIITSINLLRKFRNVMAHNLKAIEYKYNKKISGETMINYYDDPIILSWNDIKSHNRGLNDLYSVILIIIIYLDSNDLRLLFLNDLLNVFFDNNTNKIYENESLFEHYIKFTNLPNNLENRLKKLYNKYTS